MAHSPYLCSNNGSGRLKKKIWTKPWINRRDEREGAGTLSLVYNELRVEGRMDENAFNKLQRNVGPKIARQDTVTRQCIPTERR